MARGQPDEETYQPRVQPEDLPRKVIPEMSGASINPGVQNFVNTVEQKYQADSATFAGDQLAQARVKAVNDLEQAKSEAPPGDQTGFTAKYLTNFDKSTSDIMEKSGTNPVASKMLHKGLQDLRDTLAIHSLGWEAQQNVDYRKSAVETNLSAQLPIVAAHPELADQVGSTLADQIRAIGGGNETMLPALRSMHQQLSGAAADGLTRQNPRGMIEAMNDPSKASPQLAGVLSGLSDAQRESMRQKANEGLTKPIYGFLEDNDFKGAQKALNANKDILDPRTTYAMQNTIDAKSKEKANENKQDISDRLQDSMVSAQYGLKNPISVTRAEMDVLYPKDAQRHWDALTGLVDAGAKSKEYDQMTPEQIQADVTKSQPTEGGPEAALRVKAYEIRANAAEQSIKARNQDPAQFAIDSGTGWKPLDLSKPDEALANLKSRANSQGQISEQTGVNTPLLSKQETKQFTGWLDNQKPSDRLNTLVGLRNTLPNDQAYGALMKQIAPQSPVTAVAGAMLDKPPVSAPSWYDAKFTTNPVVPQRMLEGEEILRPKDDEKGIKSPFPMPKDSELQAQFQSAVGGPNSDLFRGRPETLSTMYAGYKAYYAAEASHRGVTNGVINTDIAQLAAQSVVGHATTYSNSNLVVPAGMDPTKFEGTVDTASRSALMKGGYSDKDIEALHGYGMRELGDTLGTGRYVIINGNGDPLKSKNGQNTVIVDLNKARSQHASVFNDSSAENSGERTTIGDRR